MMTTRVQGCLGAATPIAGVPGSEEACVCVR
jgi:hypothetical protein